MPSPANVGFLNIEKSCSPPFLSVVISKIEILPSDSCARKNLIFLCWLLSS